MNSSASRRVAKGMPNGRRSGCARIRTARYIGALLCSANDTLRPGREMAPNHARLVDGAPKAKRKYTFTTYLTGL